MDWNQFKKTAEKVAQEEGFPLPVLLGQAALETGRSPRNASGNNWFGMKGRGNAGSNYLATKEQGAEGLYDTASNFAAYSSAEDSIRAYINMIKAGGFSNAWSVYEQTGDPLELLKALKAGGYATDDKYISKVTNTPEWKDYGGGKYIDTNPSQIMSDTRKPSFEEKRQMYEDFGDKANMSKRDKRKIQKINIDTMRNNYVYDGVDDPKNPWQAIKEAVMPGTASSAMNPRMSSSQMVPTTKYPTGYKPRSKAPTYNKPYTVQAGDTLWGIAEKNLGSGSRYKELGGYSGSPTELPIGQRITIPSTRPAYTSQMSRNIPMTPVSSNRPGYSPANNLPRQSMATPVTTPATTPAPMRSTYKAPAQSKKSSGQSNSLFNAIKNLFGGIPRA